MDRLAPLYSMLPPPPSARLGRASALFRKSTTGRLASRRVHAFDFSGERPGGSVRQKNALPRPHRIEPPTPWDTRSRAVPRRWDSLSRGDITCLCPLSRCPAGVDGGGLDRAMIAHRSGPDRRVLFVKTNPTAGTARPAVAP